MKSTLTVVLALLSLALYSQDYRGCHYFKNIHTTPRAKELSMQERMLMEASIQRSDTFDIVHYDIYIDVTAYSQQLIDAATTVTYKAKQPNLSSITFDLLQLTVDSVKQNNEHLVFNHDGELLQVYFSETPVVGQEDQLTVYYQGHPHQDPFWGGFYFESDYIYNLGIGLTTVPPNFGKVWYPCFDTFVERADYTYRVKSAGNKRAVGQGDLVEETLLGGDTIIRVWDFPHLIPTHISAIAVSDYQTTELTHQGVFGPVDITLTSKPAQHTAMNNVFQELGYAIDACEYWWGPNPFPRVGYVLTTDGALEIPTNIAYPQFMTNESLASNGGLFSHELGHHWWGDIICMRTHNDMWMKEGPAEYSSHLFVEVKDGREEFVETVKDNHLFVLEEAHVQDGDFYALSPMPDEVIYGRHTYYKGASVLHNLRGYLGDELYRSGMQAMQTNLGRSNLDAAQFRDSLSAYTGYDLTAFFDDQVFQPGFSTFVVDSVLTETAGTGFTSEVYVQQKLRAANDFYTAVPLDVTAYSTDWEVYETQVVLSNQLSSFTLNTPFEPAAVFLNANGKLNQARMDHTYVVDEPSGILSVPFCDIRLGANVVPDSALVRVEHQWAAPDNNNLSPYIYEISSTHYWIIDGVWPDGLELDGRINYNGNDQTDLDYDLVGGTEANLMLVWRATSADPWINYPFYEWQPGTLTNGAGLFNLTKVLKGQYAFANGDVAAAVAEEIAAVTTLFPNPTTSAVTVTWNDGLLVSYVSLYDEAGRRMLRHAVNQIGGSAQLEVSGLAAGAYIVELEGLNGQTLDVVKLQIRR
ncbi:MAG: hypothetical protein RL226_957 [Bacteroidota bacterium]